jgi:hypothetical protein
VRDWREGRGIPRVAIGVIIERETAVHRVEVRKTTLVGAIQRGWILVNDRPMFPPGRGRLSQSRRDSRRRISLWIRTLNRTVGFDTTCATDKPAGTFLANGPGAAPHLSWGGRSSGTCVL